MKCAYCGNEAKGTKEHIVSCAILDLFPECNLTYDTKRNVIHQADPMVKDVCADCNNNKISYIDSYAKSFIGRYFTQKYSEKDSVEIEYNFTLIQKMLLKYAFNDMRSRKEDCSYFDKELISYLTNESEDTPKEYITVLCGLAVNTSPIPEFMTGNLKLRWAKNPLFYANSTIKHINYSTGEVTANDEAKREDFPDLALSYVFRFNSVQFILLCWKKDSVQIERNNVVLKHQYPYEVLNHTGKSSTLPICTDEINYHVFEHIHVAWDGLLEVQSMRKLSSGGKYYSKEAAEEEWKKEEENIAKKHPR